MADIIANETFSTGDVSMFKGEIRDVDETNPYALQYYTLGTEGAVEEYVAPIVPSGTKTITANGTGIDVAEYADVDVNVPNPSTGSLSITANGTYDVTTKASAVVNVSSSATFDVLTTTVTNSTGNSIYFTAHYLRDNNGAVEMSNYRREIANGGSNTIQTARRRSGSGATLKTDNYPYDCFIVDAGSSVTQISASISDGYVGVINVTSIAGAWTTSGSTPSRNYFLVMFSKMTADTDNLTITLSVPAQS